MALRILAADNDAEALKTIKETAESLGHEVAAFSTGLEAAHQVHHQKFDGAFVGASIPHPDGFAVVQLIRSSQSNARIPIVMLTDFSDAKTTRKAFGVGVTFLLNKPLDPKRLQALLGGIRGQMLNERRRYARLPLRTIVQYRGERNESKTMSVNVSQTGMLLEGSGGLAAGQEAELQFELPDTSGQLTPRAKVVRKETNDRTGVHFSSLSAGDRKALSDFVTGTVKS